MLTRTALPTAPSKAAKPAPSSHALSGGVEVMGAPMTFGRNVEIYGEDEPADYLYEVVSGALVSLRKNKAVLHGSTARGLRDLIARYRALDVTDDRALRAMIGDVERELARPVGRSRKRDTTEIAAVLGELQAYTHARARQLLDPAANTIVEL